jgi:hypothetical protein
MERLIMLDPDDTDDAGWHPWDTNDGVYITPSGCPCRIKRIEDDGVHVLEVYSKTSNTVDEWMTDEDTFLNRYKRA